ncbi:MAG: type III-A CRISPR-associated CARF protein Csm6 [Lachnospiraceae bacterium]|jgi:hypothetical protein
MGKTILFSPVGGTDPMSEINYYDGALLHVARHYQPDVIYLYLSQEMLQNSEKDDRYHYCLNKLGERLQHPFEIHDIKRPELVKVQLFNPIFEDLQSTLMTIVKEQYQPGDELLLNISSGTPSMKSALFVLATMLEIPCKCIQVDTPAGRMNQHSHSKDYEPEVRWELNEDNRLDPSDVMYNRCHEEKLPLLKQLKYEEVILKFIDSYDYHAARVLAEDINHTTPVPYLHKLILADYREQMNRYSMDNELRQEDDQGIYRPFSDEKIREPYEYMLLLQIHVAKGQYADFVRALTPLLFDLNQEILSCRCGVNISDYTRQPRNDFAPEWDMIKIEGTKLSDILGRSYADGFKGGWVKNNHMANLISGFLGESSKEAGCAKKLSEIERKVRNEAAHQIRLITNDWIRRKTGYTAEDIVKLLHQYFSYTSYNIPKDKWDSYDVMNQDIRKAILAAK